MWSLAGSTVKEEDLPPVSRGRERVAPLVERKAESAFPWGTHWWRCKYEIREAPPEVLGDSRSVRGGPRVERRVV